jgi:ABC-type transporter Mla subunit MlaD
VTDAVANADPGLGRLVQSAGTTLDAIASEADSVQTTLDEAPSTFDRVRSTLAVADRTLNAAGRLTDRISPGVVQLRRIAQPLNSVLGTVNDVAPTARRTLATLRTATPALNPLLRRVEQQSPRIASISTKANTQLTCIRPYTPDIVSFFTNWGDFMSATDGRDKYIRANVQSIVPAPYNTSYSTSGELAKNNPGLRFNFPTPPGANAGQPWYLPDCGAGPDALNPFKDREARAFSPLEQIPTSSTASGGGR